MADPKQKQARTNTDTEALGRAMGTFGPAAVEAWQEIMTESTRFVTERLQKDAEVQQALLNCKNPTELLQVQTEFYETAVKQYSAEATRMFEIMAKGAGIARKYDDVPL